MRKYDYSFLNQRWKQLVGYIEEVSSLKDNFEKVVEVSRKSCKTFISVISILEDINLEENLNISINELRSKGILNNNIYLKIKYIENEYLNIQSSNYFVNEEMAEICLDNLYEIVKWYSDKYESNNKYNNYKNDEKNKNNYKKVIYSKEDLEIFAEHKDIQRLLYQGKECIERDKNDILYLPSNSIINARKIIEYITIKIQNKFGIKSQGGLLEKIESLEAIIRKDIYYKMISPMLDRNYESYFLEDENSRNNETKAVCYLNLAYEVSKWYIDFIK